MTESTAVGRPPKHDKAMPIRSIRCDPVLWEAARQVAETRGETITDAITAFLRRYAARAGKQPPA